MRTTLLSLTLLLVAFASMAQEEVTEPETIGEVAYLSGDGIQMLEMAMPDRIRSEFSTNFKVTAQGDRSSFRISDATPEFVLNTSGHGMDLTGLVFIFKTDDRKGRRRVKYKMRNPSADANYIPYEFVRYGERSYRLKVLRPLERGEYMIVTYLSKRVGLFGID